MGAKARYWKNAWWVTIHHGGRKKMRRIGTSRADKRVAEEAAAKINAKIRLGEFATLERGPIPFDRRAREWLKRYSPTFKPSFETSATSLIKKHLVPHFGSRDLRQITREDLLDYVGVKVEEGLSRSTIENGLSILRRVMSLAVEAGELDRNPALRLGQLLKGVDGRALSEVRMVDAWTRQEMNFLLGVARQEEPRFYPALLLAASTGMRRGEVMALQWRDIDFEAGRIHVRRALVRNRLTPPKSGRDRLIGMPPSFASYLVDLLAERRRQCLRFGWSEVPEWILPNELGGPIEERNFERSWFRLLRKAEADAVKQGRGFRRLRFHDVRHTYASQALGSGKSVRWVASQLGHADPALTLRVYAHVLPSEEFDLGFAEFGDAKNGAKRHPRGTSHLSFARTE